MDGKIPLYYTRSLDVELWKESLNNDGQQLHQYQQNEQPPLTSNNTTTYRVLEIKVLDWDRHKNVTGINLLMGPSLFDKWVFDYTLLQKRMTTWT